MELVKPALEYLPGYKAALERGWSHDNLNAAVTSAAELGEIAVDAFAFVTNLEDRDAKGGPLVMPDGSRVSRLPGFHRWMWDGEFCGAIKFRWQPGTSELPAHVLGHIGYAVVPWKQKRGYATKALKLLLAEVAGIGLPYVEFTTNPDNTGSQKVIMANGGVFLGPRTEPAYYGHKTSFVYRIAL